MAVFGGRSTSTRVRSLSGCRHEQQDLWREFPEACVVCAICCMEQDSPQGPKEKLLKWVPLTQSSAPHSSLGMEKDSKTNKQTRRPSMPGKPRQHQCQYAKLWHVSISVHFGHWKVQKSFHGLWEKLHMEAQLDSQRCTLPRERQIALCTYGLLRLLIQSMTVSNPSRPA